jgi:hypothetical protein
MIDETRLDGTTSRSIVWAMPVNLSLPPSDQGRIVKTTGLGLSSSDGALAFGYFDNSRVELDSACHVVLIGNTDEQLRRFAELAGDTRTICDGSARRGDEK